MSRIFMTLGVVAVFTLVGSYVVGIDGQTARITVLWACIGSAATMLIHLGAIRGGVHVKPKSANSAGDGFIREGMVRKCGLNGPPTTARPNYRPKGQGGSAVKP